eukprot:g34877.t1
MWPGAMEYALRFWYAMPNMEVLQSKRKDVMKVERVQKRFARMLPELEGLSYRERLDWLGPLSLDHRKLSGDLIEVYKILTSIGRVNSKSLFPR